MPQPAGAIVATMMVRDEIDVVALTIEHYRALGFDRMLVTDNGSVDGTRELLEDYAAHGFVDLYIDPVQKKQQSKVVTRMARVAAHSGASWVFHVDADEFLMLPDRQSIQSAISSVPVDVGTLRIPRNNMVGPAGAADEPNYKWVERLRFRDTESLTERGTPLQPKVAHRAARFAKVAQGNHSVFNLPRNSREQRAMDAMILHFPMRTWEQFRRKIENSGTAYAANRKLSKSDAGFHLKNDYQRLLSGELEDAYGGRSLSDLDADEGLRAGKLLADDRMSNSLTSIRKNALLPQRLQ